MLDAYRSRQLRYKYRKLKHLGAEVVAYTEKECMQYMHDLLEEYIRYAVSIDFLRSAARNEYQGQMNEQVNSLSREKLVCIVLKYFSFDPINKTIWCNSSRTHGVTLKEFIDYWQAPTHPNHK